MNIYENNKQLLTTMGGDSANFSTDYEVRKAILDLLGGDSSNCNSIYEVDKQILKIYEEGGVAGGGEKVKVLTLDIDKTCIVDGTWGAESIDTSLMTSFSNLFYGCSSLQSLDLSNWDVSNVKDIQYMFFDCSSLQSVGDLSNWDVSNVKYMQNMFYNCKKLQSLDVSGWNTSNVTNMSKLFSDCYSLTKLDVSSWNTSNVTNMSQVFVGCKSLTQLDLTNWDASKVTTISIFCDCQTYNFNSLNVVGGLTYDEVVSNNICILNGLSVSANRIFGNEADRASYRALFNGLADLTGSTTQNLRFYSTSILTDEDIAVATAKNWTISTM